MPSVTCNRANGDWGIHLIDTSDDEICDFLAHLMRTCFFNVKYFILNDIAHYYLKTKQIC